MKILIVSDTHRKNERLKKVIEAEAPMDMVIHLGDAEGSEVIYQNWLPLSTRLIVMRGNNDFFSTLASEKELMIGKKKCLLTHGHYYNVSLDTEFLYKEAKARGFDIAMFGHTHRPFHESRDGITLINPGSISFPRQEGRKPTYMIMETDGKNEPVFSLKVVED